MRNFELTPEEIIELRRQHKFEKSKRNAVGAYKINTIILLGVGWSLEQVSEALLLDEETLRSYIEKYKFGGIKVLLNTNYQGGQLFLTEKEVNKLKYELDNNIHLTTKSIVDFVTKKFNITYTVSGMTALLHRLGYIYKKPKLIPPVQDEITQEIFVKQYQEFINDKPVKKAVFFVDAVHPEHNTMASYGWFKKGEERKLSTHCGRKRLNLHGAVNPETLDTFVIESSTIDSGSTISLFETLEKYYPLATTIYVILDNAGYHKSQEVREYLVNSRIKAIFLPSNCPNLNLIERLWKLFKKSVLYNKYFPDFKSFRKSCINFFIKLTQYENELHRIMSDEFEIITV